MSNLNRVQRALLTGLVLAIVSGGSGAINGCVTQPLVPTAVQSGVRDGASPAPSPSPFSSPVAASTALPTPYASVMPAPVPSAANPLRELHPFTLKVGVSQQLVTRVGQTGGDWGIPDFAGYEVSWRLAPGDRDRATLDGNVLTASKPGPVRLIATAGPYRAWMLEAAVAADMAEATGSVNVQSMPTPAPLGEPRVVQDATTWATIWNDAFTPKDFVSPPGAPTAPPPPPPVPTVDFTQRSLLFATVDLRPHTYPNGMPQVTHREGAIVHVVMPDVWLPDDEAMSAEQIRAMGWQVGPATITFNLPKLPDQVSVQVSDFEVPEPTPSPSP